MNDFEHIQSVFRLIHNQQVTEFFKDVDYDENVDDIRNLPPRASLKKACIIMDNDNSATVTLRLQLFDKLKGKEVQIYSNISKLSTRRRHKPKICLHFLEDLEDVDEGYEQVEGQIGFRLMNAGSDNDISESQARSYANKIKTLFSAGEGYVWHKGKDLVSYSDWNLGYQLQILCRSKSEGMRIVEQVLDVQNHSPDWQNLNHIANEQPSSRYPTIPPTKPVLGHSQRMPRERPIADVRFQLATLEIHGMKEPLILYERNDYLKRGLIQ